MPLGVVYYAIYTTLFLMFHKQNVDENYDLKQIIMHFA